jgi:hypothetical protein
MQRDDVPGCAGPERAVWSPRRVRRVERDGHGMDRRWLLPRSQ